MRRTMRDSEMQSHQSGQVGRRNGDFHMDSGAFDKRPVENGGDFNWQSGANGRSDGRRPTKSGYAESSGGKSKNGDDTPSYWVEHLATFAVGSHYGLEYPSDGMRKLKQMEKSSAIWAQPVVLRLKPDVVQIEDENGEIVEEFPLDLVVDPTSYISSDPREHYNNILLFVVKEDLRNKSVATKTEMHIFQCTKVSANDVVSDIKAFLKGRYQAVKGGRRDTPSRDSRGVLLNGRRQSVDELDRIGSDYYAKRGLRDELPPSTSNRYYMGDYEGKPRRSSASGSPPYTNETTAYRGDLLPTVEKNYTEIDVNVLNRCFDEIERFVGRIQRAALAQQQLAARNAALLRDKKKAGRLPPPDELLRSTQIPTEGEFVDAFQKFKLAFNLLALLKDHIKDPNAPELLHYLFTPLAVIIDVSRTGLGIDVGPRVLVPLLTRGAIQLLLSSLTSKESETWRSLGEAWTKPEDEWPQANQKRYLPVFSDGWTPYSGSDDRLRPASKSSSIRSEQLDRGLGRLSLEEEKLREEKERVLEKERRLADAERKLEEERKRLSEERRAFLEEQERASEMSFRHDTPTWKSEILPDVPSYRGRSYSPPMLANRVPAPAVPPVQSDLSPRQRIFLQELLGRRSRVVQSVFDRLGQNNKELTVSKGEYLEVLNDSKNWWECRNVLNRIGFVPRTILVPVEAASPGPTDPLFVNPGPAAPYVSYPPAPAGDRSGPVYGEREIRRNGYSSQPTSPRPAPQYEDRPSYIREKQGRLGQFRYF